MVFCANGSDEALSFVFYAFFGDDRPLVTLEHTYSFYPVYARYYGAPLKTVPLTPEWRVDADALAAAARQTASPVILANPNAPTGIAMSRREARALLDSLPGDRAVVIDEAYADFGAESCLALLADYPNLLIVRTFSKSLSGAGLRLGYVAASAELCAVLTTVKNSFNHFPVDALTQAAGIAACSDPAWYAKNAARIAATRDSFAALLGARGWTVLPSAANFLFAKKDGVPGRAVYEALRNKGILVRHFAAPRVEDFVRITVGAEDQMALLAAALP
jgi:histidinol-phosphate aminotransferase